MAVGGAVPGERVELHEGPRVEQHLQALAGGVAALGVLAEEVGSFEEEPVVPGTMHGHPAADTPLPRTDTVHPHGGKRGDERGDMVERDRLATRQSRRPHPRFRQPEATSPSPRYRNAAAMVTTGMVICCRSRPITVATPWSSSRSPRSSPPDRRSCLGTQEPADRQLAHAQLRLGNPPTKPEPCRSAETCIRAYGPRNPSRARSPPSGTARRSPAAPDPEPPGWAWRSSSSKPRRTDGKWSTRPTWSHSSAPTPFVNGKLVERPDERRQWAAA